MGMLISAHDRKGLHSSEQNGWSIEINMPMKVSSHHIIVIQTYYFISNVSFNSVPEYSATL